MKVEVKKDIINSYCKPDRRYTQVPGGICDIEIVIPKSLMEGVVGKLYSNLSGSSSLLLTPYVGPEGMEARGWLYGSISEDKRKVNVDDIILICGKKISTEPWSPPWCHIRPVVPEDVTFYGIYRIKNEELLEIHKNQLPHVHPEEIGLEILQPASQESSGIVGSFHTHCVGPNLSFNVFPSSTDVGRDTDGIFSLYATYEFPRVHIIMMFPTNFARVYDPRESIKKSKEEFTKDFFEILSSFPQTISEPPILAYSYESPLLLSKSKNYKKFWKNVCDLFPFREIVEAIIRSDTENYKDKTTLKLYNSRLKEIRGWAGELTERVIVEHYFSLGMGIIDSIDLPDPTEGPEGYHKFKSLPFFRKMEQDGLDVRHLMPQICKKIHFV